MIDPEGAEPLYLQLAAILRAQITSGELLPNRPLPSILTLQQTYGLARGTVIHALAVLRAEGLIKTVSGRGTFVIGPPAGAVEPDE